MAEAQHARLIKSMEEMIQSLDREYIRKIQRRVFTCSADCCSPESTDSMSQVRQCIERCQAPLARAQGLVSSEMETCQDRLNRCLMHCDDKAKDLFDSGAKESAVRALREDCLSKCLDDQINQIPNLTRRIKDNLDSIQQ